MQKMKTNKETASIEKLVFLLAFVPVMEEVVEQKISPANRCLTDMPSGFALASVSPSLDRKNLLFLAEICPR